MFEHTLGWWNLAQERENNIVFIYEDMKKDLRVSALPLFCKLQNGIMLLKMAM